MAMTFVAHAQFELHVPYITNLNINDLSPPLPRHLLQRPLKFLFNFHVNP